MAIDALQYVENTAKALEEQLSKIYLGTIIKTPKVTLEVTSVHGCYFNWKEMSNVPGDKVSVGFGMGGGMHHIRMYANFDSAGNFVYNEDMVKVWAASFFHCNKSDVEVTAPKTVN